MAARRPIISDKFKTPEYRAWAHMRNRCFNPRNSGYPSYGGRGIEVCARWLCFNAFLADMGPKPSRRHSIDRIDNNGHYEPGNCRWATSRQQLLNRRCTRFVVLDGETLPLAELAKRSGHLYSTVYDRLNRGWDVRDALSFGLYQRKKKPTGNLSPSAIRKQVRAKMATRLEAAKTKS